MPHMDTCSSMLFTAHTEPEVKVGEINLSLAVQDARGARSVSNLRARFLPGCAPAFLSRRKWVTQPLTSPGCWKME